MADSADARSMHNLCTKHAPVCAEPSCGEAEAGAGAGGGGGHHAVGDHGEHGDAEPGDEALADVLRQGETNEVIGKMRVVDLLQSMPGVGKVRARQIMERLGISESRRVRGLGINQTAALKQEFADRDSGA